MKKGLILVLAVFFLWAAVPSSSAPSPENALADLKKARLEAARIAYSKFEVKWKAGGVLLEEEHYAWSQRLLEAEKDVAKNQEEIVAAYQAHLNRMIELVKTGHRDERAAGEDDVHTSAHAAGAVYFRAEAEVLLAQAKLKLKK